MNLESLLPWVTTLVFASARLFALFIVFTMLDSGGVKGVVRVAFVLSLGLIVTPHLAGSMPARIEMLQMVGLLAKEAMLGGFMGYFANQLFWAVQSVGALVDQQTGIGMAAIIDPALHDQEGPTPGMLNQLLTNVLLGSGGFLGLLGAVYDSYRRWPVLSYWPQVDGRLEALAVHQWAGFSELVVRWAAPVLALLMFVELALGLLQRFLTTLNVFYFSQCLKIVMALFMFVLIIASSWDMLVSAMHPEAMVRLVLRLWER